MSQVSMLIIACGVLALLYGVYAIRSVLAAPAGTERMQEIAAAVQEGANAYLNRQYTTIAIAGVVIGVGLGLLLGPWPSGSSSAPFSRAPPVISA